MYKINDLKKIKKKHEANKKAEFFKEAVIEKNEDYNDKLSVTNLILLSINYHQHNLYYLYSVLLKHERAKEKRTVLNTLSLYKNLRVFLDMSTSGLFTTKDSIIFDSSYYDKVLPIKRKSILVFIFAAMSDWFFNKDREIRRRNNIINNNIINNSISKDIIEIKVIHKLVGATGWKDEIAFIKTYKITPGLKNEDELRFELSELLLNHITDTSTKDQFLFYVEVSCDYSSFDVS